MKKDLPAKGSEWVRLILSGLVFLAFIPATILALPKVMELSDPQARLQFQQELLQKLAKEGCSRSGSAAG